MDFLTNLLPGVPRLELDLSSQYQNVTLLQETFIGAFLGTFLANLGAQTVRMVLGQSVIVICTTLTIEPATSSTSFC